MRKRHSGPECIRVRQALWLCCVTFGIGLLFGEWICSGILRWLLAGGCIGIGLWQLGGGRGE